MAEKEEAFAQEKQNIIMAKGFENKVSYTAFDSAGCLLSCLN